MKNFCFILSLIFVFALSSFVQKPSKASKDEAKYVKEVNGVRIHYIVKVHSPKPGKSAKKIVFKLKNSTKSSKVITFKAKVTGEEGVADKEIKVCLKPNEESVKEEILTEFKEVKKVTVEGEKVTDEEC